MSEKIVFGYFGKKTIIFRPKIEVLRKGKKCTLLREVSPWILSKNRTFSYRRFFSCYCGKKRKISRGKNSSFKKGKKWTFLKGVSPWFLSENRTFFYRSFSQKLCQKRSFFDILRRKHSFLDQKIEVLPSAKK